MQLVLMCTSNPDKDIAVIPLYFWYRFCRVSLLSYRRWFDRVCEGGLLGNQRDAVLRSDILL